MTARDRAERAEKEIHDLLKQWPPPEPVGTVMRKTIEIIERALLDTIEACAKVADKYAVCNCHEAYTGRKLHEPNAGHIDYAEAIAEDIRALGPSDL